MEIIMATDGACSGNPGPGGWGAILLAGDHRKELCGGNPATTNNRMELTAVLEGFRALKGPSTVRVVADSQYVVKAFTDGWLTRWQANGWRKSNKKLVENLDLWEAILEAVRPHSISWEWVRGHQGHPLNERADQLANAGMATAVPRKTSDTPDGLRETIAQWVQKTTADPLARSLFIERIRSDPSLLSALTTRE